MLKDDELFQIFSKCRELGVLAMVHAENGLVVKELEKEMSQLGITGPEGHLLSRPEKARYNMKRRMHFITIIHSYLYFSLRQKQFIEL